MQSPRIIISGGGTGGHIFPAIAIANAIKNQFPDALILFVGAKGRMEMEKVPEAGYPIQGLDIAGIQRSLSLQNFLLPIKIIKSIKQATDIVNKFKPDLAVGVGGYASGPLLFVCGRKGIPYIIQEQNSYAGLTNKLLASKASFIAVAYEGMEKFFPANKLKIFGNPVRENVVKIANKREDAFNFFDLDSSKKTVLIIGGSLGARTINRSIHKGLNEFSLRDVNVIWQTGKYYFEQVKQLNTNKLRILPFIKEMDFAYAAADLIISRAGATSISELCVIGKPVVLVPSPNVAEDHQTKNAQYLVDRSAAILIPDSEAENNLVHDSLELLDDYTKCHLLGQNIKKLALLNAAHSITNELINLLKK